MSVLARNRVVFLLLSITLLAGSALASPSARHEARMVYDPTTNSIVMFGGVTPTDAGTRIAYDLNETWIFTGNRWIQRFPDVAPPARSAHSMVWDSMNKRVVLFGGKAEQTKEQFNDTWIWQNDQWSQIETGTAPSARFLPGLAYDPVRDKVVLFGGQHQKEDKSLENYYDTWEFDGSAWHQVTTNSITVNRPLLVYDETRHQVLMVGMNADDDTVMYTYDAANAKWNEVAKPAHAPACVNESSLVYERHNGKVLLVGGACADSLTDEETWEWDGTDWTKLTIKTALFRAYGAAATYDPVRQSVVMYGGTVIYSTARSVTYQWTGTDWVILGDAVKPVPRSLAQFVTDPNNNSIWLFGGLAEAGYIDDFWRYQSTQWSRMPTLDKAPDNCGGVASTYDTDRKKVVIVCGNTDVFEWDGTAWTSFTDFKSQPSARRFASLVYDPVQKKSVFFGGFDDLNGYFRDTWLWDGTNWTEVKKDRYTSRAVTMAWFDPKLQKVVMYGGIGRKESFDRIDRYSDMWSFDPSKGWTDMKIASTPGERMGAQYAIDPNTKKLILFGGILIEHPTPDTRKQIFANDMWSWDGSAWTKLTPENAPPARENGAFAYDPSSGKFVLFGGYAGYYFNDVWTFDGSKWQVYEESVKRQRAVGRR